MLEKVARRINDDAVMHLLKMMLKATGTKGVPQGGVISPLLSNLYLNEVDRMLGKAVQSTRRGKSTKVQYARFADDMVILIDAERRNDWLVRAVNRRLREELAKLRVVVNADKSRMVDLKQGESFSFLGFEYRRILSLKRKWRPYYAQRLKKRTALFEKLREVFQQHVSWPVQKVIEKINPILRGWVKYFAIGVQPLRRSTSDQPIPYEESLIRRLILGNRQIVVCQVAGDLPRLRVVDHIRKRRIGTIQCGWKPPPKTRDPLRSVTTL